MADSTKPKRTYTSARRRMQAKQTRRAIIEAARKLFTERGYAQATIDAIAQEAGVAPETIYAVFGSKLAVLRALVGVTLVGDDEQTPLLERPFIKEAERETDQRRLIAKFARDMEQIMARMSPLFLLLRTTAMTDPEIAEMRSALLHERLEGMRYFVNQLKRIGPVRAGVLEDQDSTTAWVISSAEVYDLLRRDLGWSAEQYSAWLSDALERLLLS